MNALILIALVGACAPHDQMVANLKSAYGEVPIVQMGTAAHAVNGPMIIELLAKPDGSTWTMIVTNREGQSCLWWAGESVVILPQGDPV